MNDPKNWQLKSSSCGNFNKKSIGCVKLNDLQENVEKLFNTNDVLSECDLMCTNQYRWPDLYKTSSYAW